MAWIESHQELRDHPKLKRFCRAARLSQAEAIGHLHMLWWWALTYAEDGDLSGLDDEEICEAAGFPLAEGLEPKAGGFVGDLVTAGFLSDARELHDWDDYAGRLIRRRQADRDRHRRTREGPSAGHLQMSAATVPYRTLQNPTQQNPPDPARPSKKWWPGIDEEWFGKKCKAPLTPEDIAHIQEKFPLLDVPTVAAEAMNHDAKNKRRNMRLYVMAWCRKENPRGQGSKARGDSKDQRLGQVRSRKRLDNLTPRTGADRRQ